MLILGRRALPIGRRCALALMAMTTWASAMAGGVPAAAADPVSRPAGPTVASPLTCPEGKPLDDGAPGLAMCRLKTR